MNTAVSLCSQETPRAKRLLNRPPNIITWLPRATPPWAFSHVCGVSGSSYFLTLDKHDLRASYFIIECTSLYLQIPPTEYFPQSSTSGFSLFQGTELTTENSTP